MTLTVPQAALAAEPAAGSGPRRWGTQPSLERRSVSRVLSRGPILALLGLSTTLAFGCSDSEETRTLNSHAVAITAIDEPIYDDGELTLYESKTAIAFPILEPSSLERESLWRDPVEPYPHNPWVSVDDLRVQITWVISNLDEETHNVELLVDPWNEFGRYWPGLTLVDAEDGEFLPNLSGFDDLIEVPGTKGDGSSRVSGTVTFSDTREMAADLATVMNLIANPPADVAGFDDADPLASLVNHTFHVLNRSGNDPLVDAYKPSRIAGLTGVDVGLRTYEPANVALEVVVEVVRIGDGPVASEEDEEDGRAMLRTPEDYITVGSAP